MQRTMVGGDAFLSVCVLVARFVGVTGHDLR